MPVIQKLLIAAKQKQQLDSLTIILRSDISILQNTVATYKAKDSTSQQIAQTYGAMTATMQEKVDILNESLRKQKRKTKLTGIGGLLLTGLTIYLFTKN